MFTATFFKGNDWFCDYKLGEFLKSFPMISIRKLTFFEVLYEIRSYLFSKNKTTTTIVTATNIFLTRKTCKFIKINIIHINFVTPLSNNISGISSKIQIWQGGPSADYPHTIRSSRKVKSIKSNKRRNTLDWKIHYKESSNWSWCMPVQRQTHSQMQSATKTLGRVSR